MELRAEILTLQTHQSEIELKIIYLEDGVTLSLVTGALGLHFLLSKVGCSRVSCAWQGLRWFGIWVDE